MKRQSDRPYRAVKRRRSDRIGHKLPPDVGGRAGIGLPAGKVIGHSLRFHAGSSVTCDGMQAQQGRAVHATQLTHYGIPHPCSRLSWKGTAGCRRSATRPSLQGRGRAQRLLSCVGRMPRRGALNAVQPPIPAGRPLAPWLRVGSPKDAYRAQVPLEMAVCNLREWERGCGTSGRRRHT